MSGEKLDQCSFVTIHYIICECGEKFPSEDALKTHLEKAHPRKREKKEYKCGICNEVYSTEDECIKHYESNHLPVDINLDRCEAECSDGCEDTELEPAECVVEDSVLEEGEMPPEEVALEEAIEAIKQETVEEGEIPLEAGEVPVLVEMPRMPAKKRGRKVIPKTELDPEMIFVIEHGENQGQIVSMLKKSGRLPRGARTICCEMCGKRYASNAALRYHQRTHTGERPYQCSLCPKSFTMPLFLQVHVRTHTGERPYVCPHCPKAFSNKAALLRHDRVHTGIKPYECPMCAKTFTQSNSMKLHVTTVHLKQPAPYKSKNRLIREQSRTGKPVNPRKKVHAQVDSVEVLKNGLESYVLGPLKQDLENLKSDIDMIARGEFERTAVQSLRNYEDGDRKFYKVESEVKSDEYAVPSDENVYEVENAVQSDEVYELDSAVQSDGNVYEVVEEVMYVDDDSIIAETN